MVPLLIGREDGAADTAPAAASPGPAAPETKRTFCVIRLRRKPQKLRCCFLRSWPGLRWGRSPPPLRGGRRPRLRPFSSGGPPPLPFGLCLWPGPGWSLPLRVVPPGHSRLSVGRVTARARAVPRPLPVPPGLLAGGGPACPPVLPRGVAPSLWSPPAWPPPAAQGPAASPGGPPPLGPALRRVVPRLRRLGGGAPASGPSVSHPGSFPSGLGAVALAVAWSLAALAPALSVSMDEDASSHGRAANPGRYRTP